jgi:hypothetical protein
MPIIEEQLERLSRQLEEQVSYATTLVATEENKKSLKSLRAYFNKQLKEFETVRTSVKQAVMLPYNEFEQRYKELITNKFNVADTALQAQIKLVEDKIKQEKADELKLYFNELAKEKSVEKYVNFGAEFANIGLTESLTSLKKHAKEFIDRVETEIGNILTFDNAELILAEYKANGLNSVQAIATINKRQNEVAEIKKINEKFVQAKQEELQAAQKIAEIAGPLQAPGLPQDDNPVMTVRFKVRAKKSVLKALKQYLADNEIEIL